MTSHSNETKAASYIDSIPKPSDYMRARRPDLFTDSEVREAYSLGRNEFGYLLENITANCQEKDFEHFCRRLMRKEICPSLSFQTGPTGGGDRKVDAEDIPVSSEISERFYEGIEPQGNERWAFAFSAKEDWKAKVREDVKKAVTTGRGYKRLYFVTSRFARDRDAAEEEDEFAKKLSADNKIRVIILDRTWIIETVHEHKRWDIVFECFQIPKPPSQKQSSIGKNDAERIRELESLDALINDPEKYVSAKYQLAEDCLETAILARGLGRTRHEIDARFERAQRIAVKVGEDRLLAKIVYTRAITDFWWFDDFESIEGAYKKIEQGILASEVVWDLDDLLDLYSCASICLDGESSILESTIWKERGARLSEAYLRFASNTDRKAQSLWAQTQSALLAVLTSGKTKESFEKLFVQLEIIIPETVRLADFPLDTLIRLILEIENMVDSSKFEKIVEMAIKIRNERSGELEEGRTRLMRGYRKLEDKRIYEAINECAKSQSLLAKHEGEDDFVEALLTTALAYDAAGLIWASRSSLLAAFGRQLMADEKEATISDATRRIAKKMIWTELQLGRVQCVFGWLQTFLNLMMQRELSQEEREYLQTELDILDRALSILLLRTRFEDLPLIGRIPALMEYLCLPLSRITILFLLGHEDLILEQLGPQEKSLHSFFSEGLEQEIAQDIAEKAQWHSDSIITMETAVMGCVIQFRVANDQESILLAESLLAVIESFFSTIIVVPKFVVLRSLLVVELYASELGDMPFSSQVVEDDCGETTLKLLFPKLKAKSILRDESYQKWLVRKFFPLILSELHPIGEIEEAIKTLFEKHLAANRALLNSTSVLAAIMLSENQMYGIEDWNNLEAVEFPLKRRVAWIPATSAKPKAVDGKFEIIKEHTYGIDSLKHRDLSIETLINAPLWAKGIWKGILYGIDPQTSDPVLAILFAEQDSSEKIFRGWKKRVGMVDEKELLSIDLIKGIDADNPSSYRLLVSPRQTPFESKHAGIVYRFLDIEPETDKSLSQFIELFEKKGSYQLMTGYHSNEAIRFCAAKGILKQNINIVNAWEIGPGNILSTMLGGITNPVIPKDVGDVPFWATLKTQAHLNRAQ